MTTLSIDIGSDDIAILCEDKFESDEAALKLMEHVLELITPMLKRRLFDGDEIRLIKDWRCESTHGGERLEIERQEPAGYYISFDNVNNVSNMSAEEMNTYNKETQTLLAKVLKTEFKVKC